MFGPTSSATFSPCVLLEQKIGCDCRELNQRSERKFELHFKRR